MCTFASQISTLNPFRKQTPQVLVDKFFKLAYSFFDSTVIEGVIKKEYLIVVTSCNNGLLLTQLASLMAYTLYTIRLLNNVSICSWSTNSRSKKKSMNICGILHLVQSTRS